MNLKNKNYMSLTKWILGLLIMGMGIGYSTKPEIDSWYKILNTSYLTPPNYVFPFAWTFLYIVIAISGWIIWNSKATPELKFIKNIYIVQLILNWSWSPLFFNYQLTGISLICVLAMDIMAAAIIKLSFRNMKIVSYLMLIYLTWILFASYLNFYVWQYN